MWLLGGSFAAVAILALVARDQRRAANRSQWTQPECIPSVCFRCPRRCGRGEQEKCARVIAHREEMAEQDAEPFELI
jgi:hypothetical protein